MRMLDRQGVLLLLTRAAFTSIRYFSSRRTCMEHTRDSYDFTHLLQRCRGGIKSIKGVHARIIIGGYGENPFVATKLVGKYAEFNVSSMEDARKVFDSLLDKDVFLWNMTIQGYVNTGSFVEALKIYAELSRSGVLANQYTFPFVLKACGAIKDHNAGRVIHCHVLKFGFDFDLFVGNALVAFYAKCQEMEASRRAFNEMPRKDIVSWNSIISGYTISGHFEEALILFHVMKHVALRAPDNATLVAILPACAQPAAVQDGLWIHNYIIKTGMKIDASLGSDPISIYANCGRLKNARYIFDLISEKNIVVWNAIIRCCGMHGHADEALILFSRLVESGLRPDNIIFLGLLSTCSHAGMVLKGWEIFEKMGDYGVERSYEHYACMVDLLGRAGFLNEAVELIRKKPVQPRKDVFGALLGSCRIHNNMELAEQVAEKLFILDPHNAARHITLANMYKDAGRLVDAAEARKKLREKKLKKQTGCSSVEVDCVFHTFGVEDESHPLTENIFDTLERLDRVMEDDMLTT